MSFFFGTTFYTALLFRRKAPGTISSLVVFLVLALISLSIPVKIALLAIVLALHFFCFPTFAHRERDEDPAIYTLDETFVMIALNIAFPSGVIWFLAFVIFRFFDILKPLGIKEIERLTRMPAIIRNIADDILAGIYTYIILILIHGI